MLSKLQAWPRLFGGCRLLRSVGPPVSLPLPCRLVQNAPEAAGAGEEALEQAVEQAAAAWDEASNGERAPFEAQANGALLPFD